MPILQALIPLLPLINKAIDTKKEGKTVKEVVSGSSYLTEIAGGSYLGAMVYIATNVLQCSPTLSIASLSCVTNEQWSMLAIAFSMVYARIRAKVKEL